MTTVVANTGKPAARMVSLDILRGLTVAFMILVNNAGDGAASYAQLRHSAWNGCTLTDLVFPMFLFIMGISMALSFESRLRKGRSRGEIVAEAVRRAAVIVLIGLILNALPFFHLSTLRFCGVMQRIGVCYLLAALIALYGRTRTVAISTLVLLAGYWALMSWVPVPGCGGEGVTPGITNQPCNLASAIDRIAIPVAHRYHHTFYDPEGLLSTLPALASVLIGVLTASWLRASVAQTRKLGGLAASGAISLVLGLLWSESFPLNKRLWTSSFVLVTAGVSLLLLAVCALFFDGEETGARRWLQPLALVGRIFGSNALTAYVLSEVLSIVLGAIPAGNAGTAQRFSYLLLPGFLAPGPFRSLVWSVLFVGACFVPIAVLYRRRIFLKL
ncbi:acyltransferase family protein [Silvibacterium sp.]|uniref:acyltransferase family protein n=1 Tax=Silvibacterium sp. TaxID=1964179 RepID=UPI0039E59AC6